MKAFDMVLVEIVLVAMGLVEMESVEMELVLVIKMDYVCTDLEIIMNNRFDNNN
jgi:hypothetical protein